jgi:hypothetical protein
MKTPLLQSEEIARLTRFIDYFALKFSGLANISQDDLPSTVFNKHALKSPAGAQSGLFMAVNDCVEMSLGWKAERIREVDNELAALGALTLTEARAKFSKRLRRILDRKSIKSIDEYYLLKGVVDGGSLVGDSAAFELENLLFEFEERTGGKR